MVTKRNKVHLQELSKKDRQFIDSVRYKMFESYRNTPAKGVEVVHLGKKFKIKRNVFWPQDDSKSLIQNLRIKKGDTVLDLGTGSGVIAINAAKLGAKKVVAVDINPAAVRCARENARLHGVGKIVEVRLSRGFQKIKSNELFDVIASNPPFNDHKARDFVEASMYDKGLTLYREILAKAKKHLKKNGRIYLAQANFGKVKKQMSLARRAGYKSRLLGSIKSNGGRVFYASELVPDSQKKS